MEGWKADQTCQAVATVGTKSPGEKGEVEEMN